MLPQAATRASVTPLPGPLDQTREATPQPPPADAGETAVLPAVAEPLVSVPTAPEPAPAGINALMETDDVPPVPAVPARARADAVGDWFRRGDNGLIAASVFLGLILLLVVLAA